VGVVFAGTVVVVFTGVVFAGAAVVWLCVGTVFEGVVE
jgi:hypothetical protein